MPVREEDFKALVVSEAATYSSRSQRAAYRAGLSTAVGIIDTHAKELRDLEKRTRGVRMRERVSSRAFELEMLATMIHNLREMVDVPSLERA